MSLPVEHLTAFGFPPETLEAWRRQGIERLLPLQEQALREHGFLHDRNLLVSAPTSSGKTFVAEMAAMRHLDRGRRVVYLVPTKALAEEKFRAFTRVCAPLGYRTAIATRERPDSDRQVLEGRYDLLVAVYEKMKAFLVARPEMLAGIGAVIADEVQTLGEPGRGDTVDLILTKIVRAPYSTQLILLSAVLGDDTRRLADWLGCETLVWRERPVALREGVFDAATATFSYRDANSGQRGDERLHETLLPESDDPAGDSLDVAHRQEILLRLAAHLAGNGEQTLLFVPTRYMSRNWAHLLASRVQFPPADAILDEIRAYEDSLSRDLLVETLRQGVAFHNADLAWDLRQLIERHFNRGAIRVLVSTSTLAQGVNLAGRNVLHVPDIVETDRWTGRHAFVALTRSRFRNQGGRGARLRSGQDFGRSILVARHSQEAQRLLKNYIEGDLEALEPQIGLDRLDHFVLDLVASRVARSHADLLDFFHQTFTGRTLWRADSAPLAQRLDAAIEELTHPPLLTRDARGCLSISGLGEVAAATGLQTQTVLALTDYLRQGPLDPGGEPLETLLALAFTADAHELPGGPSGAWRENPQTWVEPVRARLESARRPLPHALQSLLDPPGGFTRESLLDFKRALLLDAWIGPAETREIEEQFQMYSGAIANLATHFAWLAQGATALARALALPVVFADALDLLARRLTLGCPPAGAAFHAVRVPGLSRAYLQNLLREGYPDLGSVAGSTPEQLARCMPQSVAGDLIWEARRLSVPLSDGPGPRRRADRDDQSLPSFLPKTVSAVREVSRLEPSEASSHFETLSVPVREEVSLPILPLPEVSSQDSNRMEVKSLPDPLVLEIDLRGTGHALLGGRELELPRLSFRLLAALALAPGTGVDYEALEQALWPDAQVERQQIHSHRRVIERACARAFPDRTVPRFIQTRRGIGLELALEANRIRVIRETAS
jgi:replicative superfamily II helicase